jgi:hypothetical protein
MVIRKVMWILGVTLALAGGANAQTAVCVPAVPCDTPAAPPRCPPPASPPPPKTVCGRTRGAKKCCLWNRILDCLCIHDHQHVKIQCQAAPCVPACPVVCAPVCPAPCTPVCVTACPPPCVQKPACQPACVPASPCASAGPAAPVAEASPVVPVARTVAPVQTAAATTAEPPMSAAKADPTLSSFEALQAAQSADSKAFRQLMERRLATMAAMRSMQQNEMQSFSQLETLIRRTREEPGLAPAATPVSTPAPAPARVPVATPVSATVPAAPAPELEALGRLLTDLNKDVKQLSNKVDQIQK